MIDNISLKDLFNKYGDKLSHMSVSYSITSISYLIFSLFITNILITFSISIAIAMFFGFIKELKDYYRDNSWNWLDCLADTIGIGVCVLIEILRLYFSNFN